MYVDQWGVLSFVKKWINIIRYWGDNNNIQVGIFWQVLPAVLELLAYAVDGVAKKSLKVLINFFHKAEVLLYVLGWIKIEYKFYWILSSYVSSTSSNNHDCNHDYIQFIFCNSNGNQ